MFLSVTNLISINSSLLPFWNPVTVLMWVFMYKNKDVSRGFPLTSFTSSSRNAWPLELGCLLFLGRELCYKFK